MENKIKTFSAGKLKKKKENSENYEKIYCVFIFAICFTFTEGGLRQKYVFFCSNLSQYGCKS